MLIINLTKYDFQIFKIKISLLQEAKYWFRNLRYSNKYLMPLINIKLKKIYIYINFKYKFNLRTLLRVCKQALLYVLFIFFL